MAFKTDEWAAPPEEGMPGWDPDQDALEASLGIRPQTEADQVARMAGKKTLLESIVRNKETRELLKQRLWNENEIAYGNKLADCGLPLPLVCTHCGHVKVVETSCNMRWCPVCAFRVSIARQNRYEGAVKMMHWPLHVVLTVTNTETPEGIRDVRKHWAKFRRRKLIVERIKGGLVGVEVTNKGKGWHPHLHALVDCEWLSLHVPPPRHDDSKGVRQQKMEMAKDELSRTWANQIGQKDGIVDVSRAVHGKAGSYVMKYAMKGSELLKCQDKIGDLIRVIEKSRLMSAFGTLYGRTQEMDGPKYEGCLCAECEAQKTMLPLYVIDILKRDRDGTRGLPSMLREKKHA